jgi:hypothetical protein
MIRADRRSFLVAALLCCTVALSLAPHICAAEPNDGESSPSKFLRFVPDKHGGGTLQASTVRYENADGVALDLVAAVHIAEPSFFQALESSWDEYDAVLYELVAPKEMLAPSTQGSGLRSLRATTRQSGMRRSVQMNMVGSLQKFMRDQLKLAFQLDAIDYKRPNFVHADLDAETFQKMQSDRGESILSLMLESMFREMSRGPGGATGPSLPELLMAMNSPDKARQLKLLLARQFSRIDEQLAGMEGDKGSVLLTERNKAAMRVLRETLAKGDKRNIAIFYGAGHLKGMDRILTQEMGFHQVGPPFWRVAWDMTQSSAPPTTKPVTSHPATQTVP